MPLTYPNCLFYSVCENNFTKNGQYLPWYWKKSQVQWIGTSWSTWFCLVGILKIEWFWVKMSDQVFNTTYRRVYKSFQSQILQYSSDQGSKHRSKKSQESWVRTSTYQDRENMKISDPLFWYSPYLLFVPGGPRITVLYSSNDALRNKNDSIWSSEKGSYLPGISLEIFKTTWNSLYC